MKNNGGRALRLERLMRVRDVARLAALEKVSRAELAFARLSGVARRSSALAADYADRPDVCDAAALQGLRAYHGGIAQLSTDAALSSVAARLTADAEQIRLAHAERSCDLVQQRLNAHRQAAARAKISAQIAAQAHLARSLNNKR